MNFDRFELLTFDCYGTLIDWEKGILDAVRPVFETHGNRLILFHAVRWGNGHSAKHVIAIAIGQIACRRHQQVSTHDSYGRKTDDDHGALLDRLLRALGEVVDEAGEVRRHVRHPGS